MTEYKAGKHGYSEPLMKNEILAPDLDTTVNKQPKTITRPEFPTAISRKPNTSARHFIM